MTKTAFLILALVLIVLTTAATFSVRKSRTTEFTASPITSVSQSVPAISHSPTPTAGETIGNSTIPVPSISDLSDNINTWKLYRSPLYGFDVKYPESITEVTSVPWRLAGNDRFPRMESAHVNFMVEQKESTPKRPINAVKISVNLFRNVDVNVFLKVERDISRFQRELAVDGEIGYEFAAVIGDPADKNAVERGTRVLFVHQGTLYIVEFTLDYRPHVDTFIKSFRFLGPAISSIVPKLGNISEFAPA